MGLFCIIFVMMSKFNEFLLAILLIASCQALKAQTYFGIKATYGLSFAKGETNKYDDVQDFLLYKIDLIDQDIYPSLSVFGYYRNDPIYIQAELGYRRTDLNFSIIDALMFENLVPQKKTKRTHQVLFPIHAGVQIQNIKLGAGAYVSRVISENTVFEELDFFEERRRKLETGFSINMGLVFQRLQLELNYEIQTSGIADYFYFRGDKKGFKQDVQFVNLAIGFLF